MYIHDDYLFEQLDLLAEYFAIPVGLKEVVRIDNLPLYSSNKMIEKYKNALAGQKQFRGSEKIIASLIKRGRLIPVFQSKGIFSLTIFKMFADIDSKSICGFYSPNDNIIILVLDNNMTLGWVSSKHMGALTSHELTHMAANHMKQSFVKLFHKELVLYYSKVFENLTGCKELNEGGANNLISKYATNLFVKSEMVMAGGSSNLKYVIENFNKTLTDIHVNFDSTSPELVKAQDEIKKAHEEIVTAYFKNGIDGIIQYMQTNESIVRFILGALYNSYSVFNRSKKPLVFPIQEYFYPSEVICVKTEITNDSKFTQAWAKIK